jgi:hypothetical protein
MLLNVSIWESVESLQEFTYTGVHAEVLEHRADWFVQDDRPNHVLFWYPAGEIPTEENIKLRFECLEANGASPYVFTFERSFSVQEMLDSTA